MPAELGTVLVEVGSSAWAVVGEPVFVGGGAAVGTFLVVAIPDATHLTLQNLEDAATGAYVANSAPGTTFPALSTVSPSGWQGPAGAAGGAGAPTDATYITQTPSGSLANEQALSGLGASGMLKWNNAGTAIVLGSDGVDYLSSTTGLRVAQNLADVANAATARGNLGITLGVANTNVPTVNRVGGLVNGQMVVATAAGLTTLPVPSGTITTLTNGGLFWALPGLATKTTIAHGLANVPKIYRIVAVNVTPVDGFVANDELDIASVMANLEQPAFQLSADASNIYVSTPNIATASRTYAGKNGGTAVFDASKWKLKGYVLA